MKQKLDRAFTKAVVSKVEDCSSPIQLKAYLNRYRNYVFDTEIKRIFEQRIEFFRLHCVGDGLSLKTLDDLEDMLEFEIEVAKVAVPIIMEPKKRPKRKTQRSYIHDEQMSVEPSIANIGVKHLKRMIAKTKGDIHLISFELGIDADEVMRRINNFGLRSYYFHYSKRI